MTVFIDCIVEQAFDKLVLTGEPSQQELGKAWLHLYSEYSQRVQDPAAVDLLEKQQQIIVLESRLRRMSYLIQAASMVASEEIAEAFKSEGFTLNIEADDDTYMQQLRVIGAKLKPDSIKLDRLISESGKPEKGKEVTRATFVDALWSISEHMQFMVRIENITTGDYCDLIRRMREYQEAQRRAAQSANAA